jgi:hypothetical protein
MTRHGDERVGAYGAVRGMVCWTRHAGGLELVEQLRRDVTPLVAALMRLRAMS